VDLGRGVDSGERPARRPEEGHRTGEGQVGVPGDEAGDARLLPGGENDRGRPRRAEVDGVVRVGEEGDVPGPRLLEAGDAFDLDARVAAQLAAEPLGQLAELHAPGVPPWFP
jgi:hypothetical protein